MLTLRKAGQSLLGMTAKETQQLKRRSLRLASKKSAKNVRVEVQKRQITTSEEEMPAKDKVCPKPVKKRPTKSKNSQGFPHREFEREYLSDGYFHVAGVDEAGRGPLAGPVVAAACSIPPSIFIEGIQDSKKIKEADRERLFEQITTTPGVQHAICIIDAEKIDEINILQATMQAMSSCMHKLTESIQSERTTFLVDGNRLPDGFQDESTAKAIVKGDSLCYSIAAASILAKVTRDRLMHKYDRQWPLYGFKDNKGYGTSLHIEALLKHGPCEIHRRSFAPLKDQIALRQKNLP